MFSEEIQIAGGQGRGKRKSGGRKEVRQDWGSGAIQVEVIQKVRRQPKVFEGKNTSLFCDRFSVGGETGPCSYWK